MPKEDKKPAVYQVYAPFEVIIHNSPTDCWVSFLGKVFDVTELIKLHKDEDCIKPLVAFAGKDVSHWFDERTGEIQHFIHPVTGVEVPYCPHGIIPEVQPQVPSTDWRPYDGAPWWSSTKYQIGVLTKMVRPLKIIDMLLGKEYTLEVCCEDTFIRIRERYNHFNSEADGYTWVYMDKRIEMEQTMEQNGIPDERERMAELGIPKSSFVPSVRLYFNDDLNHLSDLTDDSDELENEVCCACKEVEERLSQYRTHNI